MADPQNISDMLVRIEATTAGLRRELDKGESKIKQFSGSSDKSAQSVEKNFSGMASSMGRIIAPLTAAVAAFSSLSKAVEVQRQFDKLNAGLVTATGSTEKAAIAFQALQDFAAKTPYSLDQAVEGFTKLVNLGLTPSEKALMSYGNTAAAMGKDLNQMIEAVADAATGEFERLKEFGITSSQQGDKVSLTFRGVSTTIGKNAKEIEGYLMNLGLVDFAGAMEARANTLDGQISNLGDTWDQTYRLINQQGLGQAMADSVKVANDALTELNMMLESGQFEGYMKALGESVKYYGEDFKATLEILERNFSESMDIIGLDGENLVESLKTAFLEVPETLRSYIQRIVVEFASGFDRVIAYGVAFKDTIAAIFNDESFADVQNRLTRSIEVTQQARQASIDQIEVERAAAVKASEDQVAAADERRKKYDEERKARESNTKDRLIDFSKQVEGAKAAGSANKELENKLKQQKKALDDLIATSKIAFDAAQGLADGYLAGKDLLYQYTLQQKVEQELLKTGAAAREKVTAAIQAQMDAEARQDVAKGIYQLRLETDSLNAQALATLQGTDALNAYNAEKAVAAVLAGKNADALSAETKLMLEAVKANQQAAKTAEQVGKVQSIMDRLKPESALLRQYTEDQKALNEAIRLNPDAAADYAESLRLLGLEYEQNRAAATAWGQFTEGAIDRVDDAFADAWKNIGKGFDGFATSLKDGFKQLLAELAHMAITKPIIMQIGAAMGVGGLSASQNGGMLGIGGSGGMNLTDLYNYGTGAYKFITGTGANLYNAYSSGGMTGVYNYGANAIGNAFSGANTAATGATQAGYTGSQFSNWVAAQNTTWGSAASSFGAIAGGIGGAIQGYQTAGIKGAIAGGVGGWGGATLGTMAGTAAAAALSGTAMGAAFGSIIPGIGTVIGAALGAAFGSKLFGGAWETKDAGLTLGVQGGDLSAQQYEYQKKKGGLFSKNKKRTRFSSPDEATQTYLDTMYDGSMSAVEGLFEQFGITISEGAIDGLEVATTQISTKGKSDEEVNKLISEWFDTTFDSITEQLNVAMGSQFREGLTFTGLQSLLTNLVGVNAGLEQINVTTLKLSPASAYAADALRQFAGGMEQFGASVNTYYQGFFSQTEREDNALAALRKQFEAFNLVLPETRDQYRKLVESMDVSYDAGQKTLSFLLGQAGSAASIYDVLERRAKEAADAQQSLADAQSEAAKAAADAAAQQLEAARQAKISYADAMQQAYTADVQRAMAGITNAIKAEQDALTESYNAQVNALNARISASGDIISSLTSMTGDLAGALKDLLGDSDAATAMLYQQGRATLESAAAIAKAGGSLASFQGLDQALGAVTSNSAGRYSNWEDFARDQGRAANLIDELNKAAGGQLTVEQRTLDALNKQLDQGKSAYDAQMKAFEGQIDLAQQQLDTLNGISNGVLSLNDALAQFATAIGAAYTGQQKQNNAGSSASLDSQIGRIYNQMLGRNVDAGGLDFWKQKVTSGALSAGDLQKAIAAGARDYISVYGIDAYRQQYGDKAAEAALKIPAFAAGGLYGGGAALVGERGPEIINFSKPGYVHTAAETSRMLNGGGNEAVIRELQALRAEVTEMKYSNSAIAKHTRKAADGIQQQNEVGVATLETA